MGAMPSPITGHAGNVEFLLHARTPGGGGVPGPVATDALLESALAEAQGTDPGPAV